jgi:hypothetical protein
MVVLDSVGIYTGRSSCAFLSSLAEERADGSGLGLTSSISRSTRLPPRKTTLGRTSGQQPSVPLRWVGMPVWTHPSTFDDHPGSIVDTAGDANYFEL